MLKDDQLGLGAKRNGGDECTGLDAFQTLLGRLNGKTDDVLELERKKREDAKLNVYVEMKLGTIRFVSGGFLVGDEVVDTISGHKPSQPSSVTDDSEASSEEETEQPKSSSKGSKKRKAEDGSSEEDDKKKAKKEKKDKKSKKRKAEAEADTDTDAAPLPQDKEKKKSKKRKTADGDSDETSGVEQALSRDAGTKESKQERKDRRAREKREKRERKEKRREEKAASKSAKETGDDTSREKKRRKGESDSALASGVSTPSESGYSTPITLASGRYLSRQRFIAQKRLAFADSTALNQVRMVLTLASLLHKTNIFTDLYDQVIAGDTFAPWSSILWFGEDTRGL